MKYSNDNCFSRQLSSVAGGLFVLAVVLLVRRYAGINHDSILYLGQVFIQRWPEVFANDLFFIHGSQSRYSLFPWLLARFLNWSNPPATFLWGSLLGLILFTAASWFFLRSILPPRQRYWALLGIISLPASYGLISMFSYGEPFLTARPFAEGLCLIAMGLLARKKSEWAFASLVIAGLLHPLQTIAATLVIWPWAIMQDRRWLHAIWLVIPTLMLALVEIRPFDGLFLQADPAWLYNLREGTPQLFLSKWGLSDAKNLGFDVLILLYAWRALRGELGSWCTAAIIGLAIGFGSSAVLVDGLNLVLPAALQLWRVHWLAHWLAMASIAAILYRDIAKRDASRVLLLTLAATLAWGGTGWGWLALSLLYAIWPRLSARINIRQAKVITSLFASALILLLLAHVLNQVDGFKHVNYRIDVYAIDRRLLAFPALTLGVPLLAVIAWRRLGENARYVGLLFGLLPLLALGIMLWDARYTTNRILERSVFQTSIFGTEIPEDSQVYWYYNSIMGPWLVLRRADYFSPGQLAGQIFNRETALDARARIERMRPLIEEGLGCELLTHSRDEFQSCRVSNASIR